MKAKFFFIAIFAAADAFLGSFAVGFNSRHALIGDPAIPAPIVEKAPAPGLFQLLFLPKRQTRKRQQANLTRKHIQKPMRRMANQATPRRIRTKLLKSINPEVRSLRPSRVTRRSTASRRVSNRRRLPKLEKLLRLSLTKLAISAPLAGWSLAH